MPYDPEIHHRRSIRLRAYDYTSPGAYFITICTHQRQPILGDVIEGQMRLNPLGQIAHTCSSYNKFSPNPAYNARFDLNASGGVNLSDVILLGPFYNKGCG